MNKDIVRKEDKNLTIEEKQVFEMSLTNVREEMRDNTYILEAVKVLSVRGYRSAIGSYWNAVIDDLRRKIMHRSLDLFNKETRHRKEVKTYEDFQDYVTDYDLIEGAYKVGVIGWEAHKLLYHARETRHVFDGHPASSEPTLIKVLDMISDCNKYVLSQDYPPMIIDIDTYMSTMDSTDYDKNEIAVDQAFSDLTSVYKTELINKFYSCYTDESSSTVLRANIEFCAPILWSVLPKEDHRQIGRRLDKDIISGNRQKTEKGIDFLISINGLKYVSSSSRRAIFDPGIQNLELNLDEWAEEGKCIHYLERLGTSIPDELIPRYVAALTLTFVGFSGDTGTNYYSFAAAPMIIRLFEKFDDKTAKEFVNTIMSNQTLKQRIKYPWQLARLRILANILLERPKLRSDVREFLEDLVDEKRTGAFLRRIKA